MRREIVCDWEIMDSESEVKDKYEGKGECLCGARGLCIETLARQQREIREVQHQELEVMVGEVRRETPDTAILVLFTGNDRFHYEAGQFITIDPHQFSELERFTAFLENVKGRQEPPRAYSLISAPHEDRLAIIVKEERYVPGETAYPPLLSPFLVNQIRRGRRMKIQGFTGAYTLSISLPDHSQILHLCAGSGVVPSLSIIKESIYRGDPYHHILLYSSIRREDILYYSEFEKLHQKYPDRFEVLHCIDSEEPQRIRSLFQGRISVELLRNLITDPGQVLAFVCGPGITPYEGRKACEAGVKPNPRFVERMVALLFELGLDKKQIKQESWG